MDALNTVITVGHVIIFLIVLALLAIVFGWAPWRRG